MNVIVTEIDARNRTGCLTGVVRRGEVYAVERVSPVEIRLRILQPAERPRPKLVKRDGLLLLSGGGVLTTAEVDRALEEFP